MTRLKTCIKYVFCGTEQATDPKKHEIMLKSMRIPYLAVENKVHLYRTLNPFFACII